jgi:hypothetical protein
VGLSIARRKYFLTQMNERQTTPYLFPDLKNTLTTFEPNFESRNNIIVIRDGVDILCESHDKCAVETPNTTHAYKKTLTGHDIGICLIRSGFLQSHPFKNNFRFVAIRFTHFVD